MRTQSRWLFLVPVAALTLTQQVRIARADDDKAGAQAAFDYGKKLMLEGHFAEACPKLQESLRMDPGVGTMLFLADCWEKTGKTASAWGEFREAEALASRQQDPREAIARKRADALEPKVAKVVLSVPAGLSQIKGVHIQRDDADVGSGLWGVPMPIDPGAHKISVSAPEKKAWSTDFNVEAGAKTATIALPDHLEDAPAAATGTAAPVVPGDTTSAWSESPDKGNTQRLIGLVAGGVGVVGLGVGAVFGLQAKSRLDASKENGHCDAANVCDPTGREARNDADSAATISTVVFTVGAVALAAGAVLYFTAPRAKVSTKASTRISPWMSPSSSRTFGSGGVSLSGSF
jgi:hypothetical protein